MVIADSIVSILHFGISNTLAQATPAKDPRRNWRTRQPIVTVYGMLNGMTVKMDKARREILPRPAVFWETTSSHTSSCFARQGWPRGRCSLRCSAPSQRPEGGMRAHLYFQRERFPGPDFYRASR